VAAIPATGGASYAPRGVMRVFLRLLVLGGLIAAGWLLGSGTSHADDDRDQPGTRLTQLINIASADDPSGDRVGVSPSVGPVVKKVLSRSAVPQLSARPPLKVVIPQPIVKAVGVSKPPATVLAPVVRPLSAPVLDRATVLDRVVVLNRDTAQPPAQPDRFASVLSAPAAPAPTAAPVRTTAVPALTPAPQPKPIVALCSLAESPRAGASPAEIAADPTPEQTIIGSAPGAPIPASPPGSTTSPCMIGGSGGGTGTKNTSDIAVRDGGPLGNLSHWRALHSPRTTDLPPSLSAQPSTSPD